ncbi:MAG: hypothetical protein WCQ95_14400 [Bacteroidota bacterium]
MDKNNKKIQYTATRVVPLLVASVGCHKSLLQPMPTGFVTYL